MVISVTGTIFALSTPPGKSGVAVVRVSGPLALGTLRAFGLTQLPPPREAKLAGLRLADGALLDWALIVHFVAPHSFTGEDTVEYHIHGSRAVIARLLLELGSLPGIRPAEPGEFSRRAFLNGKMDLTAAEGLADLIDAETESQRRQALRFMQGQALIFYQQLRQQALESLALIEAYIDFPDEEIPDLVLTEAAAGARELGRLIESQLADSQAGERVRDGVQVAIIGPPNAGKSSLMNLLAGRDVAIVSHIAGTTRDVIEVHLDLGGYAVVVADTAGLREAGDEVEREGIRRSHARAEAADIKILMLDASSFDLPSEPLLALMDTRTLVLFNKTDLAPGFRLPSPAHLNGASPLLFCARDGSGLGLLLERLTGEVASSASAESAFITRSRHRHHLTAARSHLLTFARDEALGLELKCEELRRAAHEIGRITGVIAPDEVLGEIFGRFCIGK